MIRLCAVLSILWILCLGASAEMPDRAPKQNAVLRISPQLTLLDLFDGGFRPYRTTVDTCDVGWADIALVAPPNQITIQFDAKHVSFSISKYDSVDSLVLESATTNVQAAGFKLKEIAKALGVLPSGLDDVIAQSIVKEGRGHGDWTQDWSNEWCKIRMAYRAVTYMTNYPTQGNLEMRANVILSISWKPTEVGPTFRRTQIIPPKGYEYISMEVPTTAFVRAAQTSNSPALAHLRYPDAQKKPTETPKSEEPPLVQSEPIVESPAIEIKTPFKPVVVGTSSAWFLWTCAITTFAGLVVFIIKRRK